MIYPTSKRAKYISILISSRDLTNGVLFDPLAGLGWAQWILMAGLRRRQSAWIMIFLFDWAGLASSMAAGYWPSIRFNGQKNKLFLQLWHRYQYYIYLQSCRHLLWILYAHHIMNYLTDFSRAFDLKWSEKINYHFFINDKSCCMKNAILLLFVAAVVLKSFEHDLFICI